MESKIIGNGLVNNPSSERSAERPDPQAFGLDIGVSASVNQSTLSTPLANAASLQIFPSSHSFWPLEAKDASQTEQSGNLIWRSGSFCLTREYRCRESRHDLLSIFLLSPKCTQCWPAVRQSDPRRSDLTVEENRALAPL